MRHPRLRTLRLSLITALAAAGCQQEADPAPPDAAPPDAAPPDALLPDEPPCLDPDPILDPDGEPTGVERCADGTVRRAAVVECAPRPAGEQCDGQGGDCGEDADCTGRDHGRCVVSDDIFDSGCVCRFGCASDADCDADEVCLCAGVIDGGSRCAPASCVTGADCASGACLINSTTDDCYDYPQVACLDPQRDACRSHADCGGNGLPGGPNCIRSDDLWTCQQTPVCGRPLTLAGAARTAPATTRDDWATPAPGPAIAARPAGVTGLRAALLDAIA